MQIILDTEERWAAYIRRCDPWLPDNIVADLEIQRLRKPVGQIQFMRMFIRSAAKAKKEGKLKPPNADLLARWREEDLWERYDKFLRWDVIH
jgi:hypothetical protein